MDREAFYGRGESISGFNGHCLNFERFLQFGIRDNIVFSKLVETERVEGQMENVTCLCTKIDHSSANLPDMRPLSHGLTHCVDQLIGG